MLRIKTADKYYLEENLLENAGEHISKISRNTLIVGGKIALSVVGESFFNSLTQEGIEYKIKEFIGYPTLENIEDIASYAKSIGADSIIGIGGGRVLDTVKAAGEQNEFPVITIPTIAATCAAWSALTVLYDSNGVASGYKILETSPNLILADITIISKAPVRYLNAGIADTIVKWYEFLPYAIKDGKDLSLRIGLNTSKLILDILERSSIKASKDNEAQIITDELIEVVDAILVLAGLVGSITDGKYRAAIAHALHNSFTVLPETHDTLHGEKVIFGLIVQFILEEKSEEETIKLISYLNELNLPITLEQLGIVEDVDYKVISVAQGLEISEDALNKLDFKINTELVISSIIKADKLGKEILNKN